MVKKRVGRFVYWTPRIVSILFILFLALFSLDVFDSCSGVFECVLGLFMHNIPSLVLLIIVLIAWKREIVGAYAFAIAGLLYIGNMVWNALSNPAQWYMLSYSVIIAGPAFLIAWLYWLNWRKKKK